MAKIEQRKDRCNATYYYFADGLYIVEDENNVSVFDSKGNVFQQRDGVLTKLGPALPWDKLTAWKQAKEMRKR